MYGNLLAREIVVQLVKEKVISIDKFDSNEFGTAHYPVYASQFIWNNNGKTCVHDFNGGFKSEVQLL